MVKVPATDYLLFQMLIIFYKIKLNKRKTKSRNTAEWWHISQTVKGDCM